MIDSYVSTAESFLAAFDRLPMDPESLVPLDAADARHVARLASWLSVQRDNPWRDWDYCDLCLFDLADSVLAWLEQPQDRDRWARVFLAREHFSDAL
jgi:hypothetical protein